MPQSAERRRELKLDPVWRARKSEIQRAYYARNQGDEVLKAKTRRAAQGYRRNLAEYLLFKNYGLTCEDWARMFEAQLGNCAACGDPLSHNKSTHVDHCHKTKIVRGLVHSGCNAALGQAKDSPEKLRRLAAYLERFTVRAEEASDRHSKE